MNQQHDNQGRFSSGDGSGGKVTNTVKERQAMRAMVDRRKFESGRTSNRNINPPAMRADVAHLRGVMNATTGKTLAQVSAMGTNPNVPPPKIGGGN
jgi:hypothetical protein